MPNKSLLVKIGLGLAVAAALVGLILVKQRGATPRLAGEVTSVRTLGMDAASSVAIVDFRLTNPSRILFVVQSTGMSLVDASGQTRPGQMVAASDANYLFELFPALGARTAETLVIKTRIAPAASLASMLTARFEISKAELDARRSIVVSLTDADGSVSEIIR